MGNKKRIRNKVKCTYDSKLQEYRMRIAWIQLENYLYKSQLAKIRSQKENPSEKYPSGFINESGKEIIKDKFGNIKL